MKAKQLYEANRVGVKKGRAVDFREDRALSQAILEAMDLSEQMRGLKEKLDVAKQVIISKARILSEKQASVTFLKEDISCKVNFMYDLLIKEENMGRLREILGSDEKVMDLVKIETTYKPSKNLRDMAGEDEKIKELITVKEKAPQVTIEKKAE